MPAIIRPFENIFSISPFGIMLSGGLSLNNILKYKIVIVFILSPVPLFIFVFLNVCNSYNRSLLKMYVVAYETSSKPENLY